MYCISHAYGDTCTRLFARAFDVICVYVRTRTLKYTEEFPAKFRNTIRNESLLCLNVTDHQEDKMDRSPSTKEDFADKDETDIYLFLVDSGFDDHVAKVFESEYLKTSSYQTVAGTCQCSRASDYASATS